MELTDGERELVAAVGFEEDICWLFKQRTGGSLRRLVGRDSEMEEIDVAGLVVASTSAEAEKVINDLQPGLGDRGYRLFWTELRQPNGLKERDGLCLIRSTDPSVFL